MTTLEPKRPPGNVNPKKYRRQKHWIFKLNITRVQWQPRQTYATTYFPFKHRQPMSCSTYSKEKKKRKNFEKLELKTIIFCIHHFDCWCASSNTSPICLHPLQNYRRQYFLTCLIRKLASPNKTIDSTPEIITSSDVRWRHVYINIMNTDDSQVTWLVTWLDVILGANPVLFLFSLAPERTKFSIFSGRKLPFRGAFFQLRSNVQRSVKSLQRFSCINRSNPVQYSLSTNR